LNTLVQQAASIDKYGYPYCRDRVLDTVEKDFWSI
jgi:hypothetical protein